MTFIKTPTKGMRDFLPKEMELREYVLNIMKETYKQFGFEQIRTPVVEHIENLTSNQGGENEKLIFKILKRGEKLAKVEYSNENDLVDSGLRYDLTVPLTRLYANNMQNLPFPFRAFQIGYSYRAERPQHGRYRELMQCDLDILGEKTNLAEIELITAVITFLQRLEFQNFTIKINDRRILKAMLEYANMPLSKIDKIGITNVKEELQKNDIPLENIEKYLGLFNKSKDVKNFCKDLPIDTQIVDNLEQIINIVLENVEAKIEFDPTLVRGMGYYTGPIFEIYADGLDSAIAGGGRYDKMIEKYTNMPVSACGFSIGFERLILLLEQKNITFKQKDKYCYVIYPNKDIEQLKTIIKEVNDLRKQEKIVKVVERSKNFKHQKEMLLNEEYQIIEK